MTTTTAKEPISNLSNDYPLVVEPNSAPFGLSHFMSMYGVTETVSIALIPVVLAICSVLSYILAYCYESGIASTYGYQRELITPTWTTLFVAASSFLGTLVCFHFVYQLSREKEEYSSIKDIILAIFVYGILTSTVYYLLRPLTIPVLTFMLCSVLTGIRNYYWHQRCKRTGEIKPPSISNQLFKDWSFRRRSLLFYIMYLVIIVGITPQVGAWNASQQKVFPVITYNNKSYAVLRIYGDRIICGAFSLQTHTLSKEYIVLTIADHPIMQLQLIGPLHLP